MAYHVLACIWAHILIISFTTLYKNSHYQSEAHMVHQINKKYPEPGEPLAHIFDVKGLMTTNYFQCS